MLTLSRREDESLVLQTSDGPVVVLINQIRGSQVRVSIDAPQTIKILRDELLDLPLDQTCCPG